MGKLTSHFGGRKSASGPPPRDVEALVAPLCAPAVQLLASSDKSSSYFGGSPQTGTIMQWPCKNGRPLSFLASLHLPSLAASYAFEWLPDDGCLLFFFDVEEQPWGFDPSDRGSWAVVHAPEGSCVLSAPRSARALPRRYVEFRRFQSVPSWERPEIQSLDLSDDESDRLIDMAERSYGGVPAHQVGGYPDPIQGDSMELESQLVSNGIYCGGSSGDRSPKAERLEAGAEDWVLLFQVASDDDIGLMWGDLGNLYFWIRVQDAKAGDFDRVWTILQCS